MKKTVFSVAGFRSLSSDYLIASSPAALYSGLLLLPSAPSTAVGMRFFDDRSLQPRRRDEQAAAENDILILCLQQDFSFSHFVVRGLSDTTFCGGGLLNTLSDARLEFSFFAASKANRRQLLLTSYPAASLPSLFFPLLDNVSTMPTATA